MKFSELEPSVQLKFFVDLKRNFLENAQSHKLEFLVVSKSVLTFKNWAVGGWKTTKKCKIKN
jgi:hypothetical protein